MIAMLWFAGLFVSVIKGVTKGFENTPNIESTNSREVREKFTQKTVDVQEKNQRLMDDFKSKQERYR
jgi:hypothetical protein